jgi:Aspartyl protease
MKFSYKKVGPDVLRPIIPIAVGHKDFFINYEVLVDSGADMCLFDYEIAELLGVDVKKGEEKKVYGITGSQPETYYIHPITIKVGGWPFTIKAGFLAGLSSRYNYGVVGQKGFFDIFVVKFDLLKQDVELLERQRK